MKVDRRLSRILRGIKQRCNNKKSPFFHRYGGRGITYSKLWNNPERFYLWALSNGYKSNLVLDRKNNDKGYFPSNCQWVSRSENIKKEHRKHLYKGRLMSLSEISRETGVKVGTLHRRISKQKMTLVSAIETEITNQRGKIDFSDAEKIRKDFVKYGPRRSNVKELMARYNVTKGTIYNIIRGTSWKAD